MGSEPKNARLLAAGVGIAGDPVLVPWLMIAMLDTNAARLAAESLTMITGIDFSTEELTGSPPKSGDPDDEPLEDETAREAGLPSPDVPKVQAWWRQNEAAFSKGERYLLGKPLGADNLTAILAGGFQRYRRAAAIELALATPAASLANCSARRAIRHLISS